MIESKRFSLLVNGRACRYIRDVPDGIYHDKLVPMVEVEFGDGKREQVLRSDVMSPDGNDRFRGPDV